MKTRRRGAWLNFSDALIVTESDHTSAARVEFLGSGLMAKNKSFQMI
jgi:hypothetical protein